MRRVVRSVALLVQKLCDSFHSILFCFVLLDFRLSSVVALIILGRIAIYFIYSSQITVLRLSRVASIKSAIRVVGLCPWLGHSAADIILIVDVICLV